MKNKIPNHIIYTFLTYMTGIFFFTLFRILLLSSEYKRIFDIPGSERFSILAKSFFMGFRFDTVISGYILGIPFLVFFFASLFKKEKPLLYRFVFGYIFILYTTAFVLCASDIPYFNNYFAHISPVIFKWTDDAGFIFKMIAFDFRFWWVVIPFTIVLTAFFILNRRVFKKYMLQPVEVAGDKPVLHKPHTGLTIGLSLISIVLLFVGIRGRLEAKSPIRIGTAYFSSYPIANELGLSPVFNFFHLWLSSAKKENESIRWMDNNEAIKNVQGYLNIRGGGLNGSPLARAVLFSEPPVKANVVMIIMEGMSATYLERYGNREHMVPFLNSISEKGYCFDNTYTSGIHTFTGIYALICSFPSIKRQHPLKTMTSKKYDGMATTLKKNGYSTIYFTTHDDQFDNTGGFLRANGFERIVALQDYPKDKVVGTWGVPDDYMFEHSIPVLNNLSGSGKPFLGVFMTTSNHRPYFLPGYFSPKHREIEKQMLEYSDWSLEKFFKLASNQSWFPNTIFILISDHGAAVNLSYDMPLNFHHTPFIIYSPGILKENRHFDCLAGQLDVFPTIMGLLKLPYVNNTFGIDVLNEKRDYIFFNADDKYGVLGKGFYYISREDGSGRLYKYMNNDPRDYLSDYPAQGKEMKTYAESMFQAAQRLIDGSRIAL